MRSLFRSKHKITQEYGVNKDYYSKFGLQGHEGLDLIPTGTDWSVKALADGVVVKDEDNARSGAYGVNVTIWHPTLNKATQYCHLASNLVSLGQSVKAGDDIGIMGSTGNSTGAHVHLNLFETDANGVRQNKDNGYLGGINPLPFLEESQPVEEVNQNETKKAVQFDRITSLLHKISVIPTDRSEDYLNDDKLVEGVKNLDAENKRKAEEIENLKDEKAEIQKANISLIREKEIMASAQEQDAIHDRDAELRNLDLEKQITELNKQIDELRAQKDRPVDEAIKHYDPILEQIWPNLFKGKKAQSLKEKIWGWLA